MDQQNQFGNKMCGQSVEKVVGDKPMYRICVSNVPTYCLQKKLLLAPVLLLALVAMMHQLLVQQLFGIFIQLRWQYMYVS